MALFDVICENNLIVEFLGDEMIGLFVPGFTNLCAYHGRGDDHFAMLVRDMERGHTCLVFICMLIAANNSLEYQAATAEAQHCYLTTLFFHGLSNKTNR